MSEGITMTVPEARRLALRAQGLTGKRPASSAEATLRLIEHLGYVQIDTISVVERAHHHILWTRQAGYKSACLHRLLAQDRTIFESWTHAASYVPMSDYRFYLSRMADIRKSDRVRAWKSSNRAVLNHVRKRIRAEGPLASADFEDTRKRRGTWWDWKPAKRALEILFDTGELMVTERRNFQRVYDLAERVMPDGVDRRPPTRAEADRFAVRRLIQRMGIVSERDFTYRQGKRRDRILGAVQELLETGEIVGVQVKGLENPNGYALQRALHATGPARASRAVHLLSPFDSVVIRRGWLEHLFSFAYRLECYMPSAKRTYGYFTLPILWGDTFIGRMDAKADRPSRTLLVKQIWFEDWFRDYDRVAGPLTRKVARFAAFNQCDQVLVNEVHPRKALRVRKPMIAAGAS